MIGRPHRCPQVWTTGTTNGGRSNLARTHDPPKPSVGRDFPAGCRKHEVGRSLVRSSSRTISVGSQRSVRIGPALHPAGHRGGRREAHIPAQHPSPSQEARVPQPHEHSRRSCRAQEPPRQGPRPPVGLIHRIRDRHAFARLTARGSRIRRTALWCTWCPEPESSATSVAFAFGRAYGPAVARNRIRRRLRAILRDLDQATPLPPGLLLFGGKPQLTELTFDQLTAETTLLLTEIRRRAASNS